MSSETEVIRLLASIDASLKQLLAAKPAATSAPAGRGDPNDPIIPFGRDKGRRVSECPGSWEFLSKMAPRQKNDGTYWPNDLANAARRHLGLPPTAPAAPAPAPAPDADETDHYEPQDMQRSQPADASDERVPF